ncbi:MAG: T9SS type A sorting domain-containing protein [Candidatus Kapabacteria bacterium]|nr:T9SS type A sorting domain-containing protein [Ignavibacteriota bacterium]MCW5884363.1 T9SS type A sorting domain-containing protein [Candidatus Kapabacteria bacterium]
MKKLLLLIALMIGLVLSVAYTKDKNDDDDELLRRSQLQEPPTFNAGSTSFPRNFAPTAQWQDPFNAAVSTGYYWIDNTEVLSEQLFPNMRPAIGRADTFYQPELWRKITPGPRMLPKTYWEQNKEEGLAFFRQPADPDFWTSPTDSTDDAIAGPIPLGIRGGFYFNGLRYDSFYVSTNGVIALTNRRYFYDANGNRVIPPGATNCYDPMSMDWFAGGVRGRDTLWIRTWNGLQDSINPNTSQRIADRDGNGNIQYKNGLNDPVPDNFGYQFSVLGGNPLNITQQPGALSGIRARGGDIMTAIPLTSKSAVIAPFWGDMILSQYDPETKQRDEHGMVHYKRTYTNDSLIVAFFRIQPKGALATTQGTINIDPDSRPARTNYVTADAHVVLSGVDSSITIHYTRIADRFTHNGNNPLGRPVVGHVVFRYNSVAGVRGFARHVNYGKGGLIAGQPWAGEYPQATTWFQSYRVNNPNVEYPQSGSVVKFKQWQNTLRVHEIAYRVRSKDPAASNPTAFVTTIPAAEVADYELLAGHERLGAIQPVVLIQNLTNEIQGTSGINFVKQDLTFRGRFQIRNTISNRIIYNRLVPVDALCMGLSDDPEDAQKCNGDPSVKVRLANFNGTTLNIFNNFQQTGFNGVPPYYFVQIQFPPFEPNEFIDNHIGRMRSFVIAEPVNPASGERLRDNWPFDDTSKITLFVMRRYYDEHPIPAFRQFEDDGSEWHVDTESGDNIPSAWKWVSINTEMVSGDDVSKYPLSPRGPVRNQNNVIDNGIGTQQARVLMSPVIKMNRVTIDGGEPLPRYQDNRTPKRGGDEIRSFPIDLRGKQNPILTLSIQRTTHRDDWERGWSDQLMIGPEPRVMVASNPFNLYAPGQSVSNVPDEIVVEFAKPSDDEIDRITNIKLEDWRHLPYRRGTKEAALSNQAPLTLFGAGGYMIGFLETDKDSTLALPDANTGRLNSLRANRFDDGIDWEYQKFAIPIPDTFILWKNQGAKHFRFRVKVLATNDGPKCIGCIEDDTDDFYVDNIKILYRAEITDVEVTSVKVSWPYTIVPASQATSIPITVRVSNNTDIEASNLSIKVNIWRTNSFGEIIDDAPIYCRTQTISNLVRRGTLDQLMPSWNARKSLRDSIGYFRLIANVFMNEPDLVPRNDTTYSDFILRVGRVFAYDPPDAEPSNSGMLGANGLNFLLPQLPSGQPRSGPAWDGVLDTRGAVGGSGSGAVAVKFNLLNSDTLRGFSVLWAPMNQAADQITMSLYTDGDRLPLTNNLRLRTITTRGGANFQNIYGRYVDYIFNTPQVLERGTYWISISQDGETGMELGAASSRGGMRTLNTYVSPAGVWGEAGTTLSLDKNFRKVQGGNFINDNFFAFQNVSGALGWVEFTPSSGNIGFGHLNHYGAPVDPATQTMSRGFWVPMIRPYFGPKGFGEAADEFQWCPDDIPVELYTFTGSVRTSGIDLYWETASEINNYGFFVERRIAESDEEFKQIGFVAGVGNSNTISRYNFMDKDVQVKTTYEYRLRQMDRDGTQDCFTSNIVTLTYDRIGDLVLEQNQPNPFVNQTLIKFNVPQPQNVKLDIVDMFGNVVRVLANESMSAKEHSVIFDGNDSYGNALPSGSYIYRLTSEGDILTGKMSIVR